LVGCGGPDAEPAASNAGGADAGGAAGISAGGAAGGSGGGASAVGGAANAGGGSTTLAKPCEQGFGPAYPLLHEMDSIIHGPSITADGLELYYAVAPMMQEGQTLVRRRRSSTSELFGAVEQLPELAGACGDAEYRNPDIAENGLTLYVTCTARVEIGLPETTVLRVARRASREQAFTLEPEPGGPVFAAAAVSADELMAVSNGEIWDTEPRQFRRASRNEPFGTAEPIPGITEPLNSPDLSTDALVLVGSTRRVGFNQQISWSRRASADADFSQPAPLELSYARELEVTTLGAPNLGADCALYFVAIFRDAPGSFVMMAAPL
jgi:hypothetical protein